MIKLLGMRRGKDAQRFWNMAGASLPEATSPFEYVWTENGVVIQAVGLELRKGANDIRLPTPTLSQHVLLLAGLAAELQTAEGMSAFMPTGVLGQETAAKIGVRVVIKAKDATTYSGPVAIYHLLSDR